jgi:hypothetical protein
MAPITKFALLSMLVVGSVSFALADDIDFLLAMAEFVRFSSRNVRLLHYTGSLFSRRSAGWLVRFFTQEKITLLPASCQDRCQLSQH